LAKLHAEEVLARLVASFSPSMQQDLFNALQVYHEQYYNELIAGTGDGLPRAQGKVQALNKLTDTVIKAREIVATIERRSQPPKPLAVDEKAFLNACCIAAD